MSKIFSIFHLNLMFSSIEENDHKKVINKCYEPLLNLIKKNNIFISVEASAYTLLQIKKKDRKIFDLLVSLVREKKCEFIGSGYSQIIGPLVPYEVNMKNLKIGNIIYKKIFGFRPKIAYINEQSFSKSLIKIYESNGYKAIILDWQSVRKSIPNINKKIEYSPISLEDDYKNSIQVIWNNSISFQKFQKYIYGEIDKLDYLKYINNKKNYHYFCVYGSDAEIFNYRPGRYFNENDNSYDEWDKIKNIFLNLSKKYAFCKLENLLKKKTKKIKICNYENPILVKKQDKYNLLRWAVTGKGDFYLNKKCFEFLKKILSNHKKDYNKWTKLLYFWSSDFRTHITNKRWKNLIYQLKVFEKSLNKIKENSNKKLPLKKIVRLSIKQRGSSIILNNGLASMECETKKGCYIKNFKSLNISRKSIFGKISQDTIRSVNENVDYFSGHFVNYNKAENKNLTDLNYRNYIVKKNFLEVEGYYKKFYFKKKLSLETNNTIILNYIFKNIERGTNRLGYITLNPNILNQNKIYYATHNGGDKLEYFPIKNKTFNLSKPVSLNVSASNCLGITNGYIEIGDNKKKIVINFKKDEAPLVAFIEMIKKNKKKIIRVFFSSKEYDDTSSKNSLKHNLSINLSIKVKNV